MLPSAKKVRLGWRRIGVMLTGIFIAACGTGERQLSDEVRELTVTDEGIIDYRGETVFALTQLPSDIEVNEGSQFHAHERFIQAEMSYDGHYIALTTTGVAHSAGWVYDVQSEQATPVAFQYGGGVVLGPWRPDLEYLVMFRKPPSGARLLSVIDMSRLEQPFEQRSDPVEIPQHDDISPEQLRYQVIDWEAGLLHFLMAGESWIYDPETRGFTN